MKRIQTSVFFCFLIALAINYVNSFKFIPLKREVVYEYEGSVSVNAQAPYDEINKIPPSPAGWKVRGTFKLQRMDSVRLAAALAVEKITIDKENGTTAAFYQNKEMQSLYNPFSIIYNGETDTIVRVLFKTYDSVWAKNFKRAMAAAIQVQGTKTGAFVEKEPGIYGVCSTEYYVTNKPNGHLRVRKTPELNTCYPYNGGIQSHRRNVLEMECDTNSEKNVIVGNEAIYDLVPKPIETTNNASETIEYYLNRAHIEGNTLLQTFESTGESQFIVSKLNLVFVSENEIVNDIDVSNDMGYTVTLGSQLITDLLTEEHTNDDHTGGRQPLQSAELISMTTDLLIALADSFEDGTLKFDEPYESRVAEVIRIIGRCDYTSLELLYQEINIGTAYRQETVRNLFYDIIPRIGTKASVMLTRNLIVKNLCKPTTAIQLLITLPFHIADASLELVNECEVLMSLGPERPDVRLVGVLSFATIVSNSFAAGKITNISFEKYVKKYFDLFLSAYDYEQKMLYLQGLRNLKLGKVIDYLNPIIRDESQSNDLRFLATWVTLAVASARNDNDKNYETFWPIFENRSAALELRVAAFTSLLTSNPTPARLMSIHALMETESNLHLINFYRTTILSLAGSTQPCNQKLRRLTSYMIRHLPKKPGQRYFVTGNYLYDYRTNEYGMGASIQMLMIGNSQTNLPEIAFFKLEQEALGKYTSQYTLYIKARGFDSVIFANLFKNHNGATINLNKLREILSSLKMPTVQRTPVHLEIILQMEGKTILLLFINQKSFNDLTDGDVMKRIMKLVQTDSHINLQNLRWPFYARYSVPTVLGTPSSLSIQNTVLSSLRGNITQTLQQNKVSRNHEIDVRHSTYTLVSSKSYNPFLNLEHSINREQGFLLFLPINSEISYNMAERSLWFSFYRPNNLASGVSLKSRTLTSTYGTILRTTERLQPYADYILSEGDPHLVASKLIDYEIKDIGLTVTGVSHPFDVMSHIKLIFNMNPTINTFVEQDNPSIGTLMELWGLLRVNDIHVGTNKKFKLLFHNTRNTRLVGTLKLDFELDDTKRTDLKAVDKQLLRLDLNLEHKSDDQVLHNLDVVVQLNKYFASEKMRLIASIKHIDIKKQEWRLCTEAIFQPIVFLGKPYSLRGNILFGRSNASEKGCPKDKSKIAFNVHADVLDNAKMVYNRAILYKGEGACPRETLKFMPPAQNTNCDRDVYRHLTTIHKYGVYFSFKNSPKWLSDALSRLDHIVTASSSDIKLFNFTDKINATVNTFSNKMKLTGLLNGKNVSVPNVPLWLNNKIDAKFDTFTELSYKYGINQMCSIIAGTVNTFDVNSINLTDYTKSNCSVLLAADCSVNSRFALFITPFQTANGKEAFNLTFHIDSDIISYTPRIDNKDFFRLNDEPEIEIVSETNSPLDDSAKFRVYTNEENLLIFEILKLVEIQYYRSNILTVNVQSLVKGNLCGLCNLPFNTGENYTYCI